jgi:hypothetical protein
MTREEPSLETLWLQNIRTMDKVQIIERSNTAPYFPNLFVIIHLQHLEMNNNEQVWKIFVDVHSVPYTLMLSYLVLRMEV